MSFDAAREKFLAAYPHLFPVLLFLALEIQNTTRVNLNLPALIITFILLYVTCCALFAVTGNVFVSGLLVSVTLLLFYTVNFYRYRQTGQVLLPQDLNLIRNLAGIAAFSRIAFHWQPACSILCIAVLHIPLYRVSKTVSFNIAKRVTLFAVSCVLMCFTIFSPFSRELIRSSVAFSAPARVSYNEIYREQGAILGFYIIALSEDANEPDGYGRAYMETLAGRIKKKPDLRYSGESVKPNVIVVMSESFWDPTNLPNITFSEDPVPNLRRLSSQATSGNVVVPNFGGMTCNIEFEFLTGHAMSFTGYGDIPYYTEATYIDRDFGRSLVSMFKANGYSTKALHTYTGTFFSRDVIYPKLGFDKFIASEDMPDARIKGSLRGLDFISDEYFYDVLIETIEEVEEPLFLFGITVQNHTPYLPEKYETTRIEADSGGLLSEEDEAAVETFLEGVYDADHMLGRLYEYVAESDEPTIILYFGDHLPLLTEHTGVYTDLGYVGEGYLDVLSTEDAYKMFTTPYIAFSNYVELPETWGDISTYFLGAVLADAAGIEMNLYYHFLNQAYDSFQVMTPYIYIADGEVYSSPREGDEDIVGMFAAFQYDKQFGQGYLDETMSTIAP